MKKSHILVLIVLLVLIIDQSLKIWVKTNMYIGEDSFIDWSWTPMWARIHFIENPGMAFGIEIWGENGQLILSLFRIVAVGLLIYFIRTLLKSKASLGLLISFSLILAGAIGNILDSAFYGLVFSASYHGSIAQFLPEGGGYAGFLHGKVVDMFYFPMYDGFFPDWMPFVGGKDFLFFRPIFNVADVAISVGVVSILLFQRSFFSSETNLSSAEISSESALNPTEQIESSLSNEEIGKQEIKVDEKNLEINDVEKSDTDLA
ncbi:MAG: lipoprotein signal peptidase [Saprospiraceae bacterium]